MFCFISGMSELLTQQHSRIVQVTVIFKPSTAALAMDLKYLQQLSMIGTCKIVAMLQSSRSVSALGNHLTTCDQLFRAQNNFMLLALVSRASTTSS